MMLHLRGSVKLLSVFVAILIAVSSLSIYLAFFIHDSPQPVTANGGVISISKYVNLSLNVTVTNAQGKVVANRYLPHDLLLNNFYYMMLYPVLASSTYPSVWDLKNTAGSLETLCYSGCSDQLISTGTYPAIISIGSGTTAPSVNDYNLTTFIAQMPIVTYVTPPQTYYGTNVVNTTISSTMTFATAKTISEAGLVIHEKNFYYMIAHDTFTTVNVPANGAITIAYTLVISDPNGVFSLNFVNWMLSMMGAYNICFGARCNTTNFGFFIVQTPSSSMYPVSFYYLSTQYTSFQIGVGTSNAAPVWTQYNLQAQIGSSVNIGTPSYVAGTNTVYFTASITIPAAATINEAAVFGPVNFANSVFMVMLWRLTFSGVTVPQGATVTITFGYQV